MIGMKNSKMNFTETTDYRRKIADFIDSTIPEAKNISRHLREICCDSNAGESYRCLEMCRYCCTDWSKSGGYSLRVIPSHRSRNSQRSRSKLNRTSLDKLLRKPSASLNSYQRKLVDRVKSSGLTITVLTCLVCKLSTKIKNNSDQLTESMADSQIVSNPEDNLLNVKKKKKKRKKDPLCGLKSSAVAQVKRFVSINRKLPSDISTANDNSNTFSKIIRNHDRDILKLDTEQNICNSYRENNSINSTTMKNGGKTVNCNVDLNSDTNSVNFQNIDSTKNLSSINQTLNKESLKSETNSIEVSSSPSFNLQLKSNNRKNKKNEKRLDQKKVLSTSSDCNDRVDKNSDLSVSVGKDSRTIKSCLLKDGEKSVDNIICDALLKNQPSLPTDKIKNYQDGQVKFSNKLQHDVNNIESVKDCLKFPIKQLNDKNNLGSDSLQMIERRETNLVSQPLINSEVCNLKYSEFKKLGKQTSKMESFKNDKINDKAMNLNEAKSKTALSLNSNKAMRNKKNKKSKNMKKFNRHGGIKEHKQSNGLNSLSVHDLLNLT